MRYLLVVATLLAGCYTPPPRVDPLADVSRADVPSRRLSVALVQSENARSARKYLIGIRYAGALTDTLFDNFTAVFRRNFRSVAAAESIDDAKASGADVIAVLDVDARVFQGFMNAGNHLELGAIFLRPDGTEIDRIKAVDDANGLASASPTGPMRELATKTPLLLEEALRASGKLQSVSPSARPAAALAAAVPQASAIPETAVPTFKSRERPDDLAVIVGIESYSDLPKAQYAERDAEAFKAYVRALGVPERNIVLLEGQKALKSALEKNVEVWLARLAKPDSRVYFYFSGHGAPSVKDGQAYLVPWDGDPNFLASTAYPVARLYKKLGELPAEHVLVALDSCFSGLGGRSVLPSGARPLITKVDVAAASGRITALTASGANEISGSLDAEGHGAFTWFLLEGLNAGKTTPRQLAEYVTPRVLDEAHRLNRDQTPQLQGDGDWPLR